VRIATFQRDDGGDEFRGRAHRAGFAARRSRGGEESAVLALHQGRVEFEQCRRPDQRAKPRQPVRAHEQRREAENEAIDGGEIGRPLPGAIADEQLVLQQQGLRGDGADATGAKELRKGDQQVDGKDDDFSHRANRTTAAGARKTARGVRVASHCEFATYRDSCGDQLCAPDRCWAACITNLCRRPRRRDRVIAEHNLDASHSPVRNRVQTRFSARLSSSVRVRSDTSFARIASVG